jgi:hypothetical protein
MPLLTSLSELCDELRRIHPRAVIGVEGFMNSGKSHLSNAIATSLARPVIHTDDFVVPGDESLPYVDRLNLNQLKSSLRNANIGTSAIVVDGICLRHALARVNVAPALFIYVKRIAANGLWHDGFHLEDYEADEQSITGEPEKSDLRYHSMERPHECAEIIFHRLDSSNAL